MFKEHDIVWRKMPLNDEISYYRVTGDIIRPDRISCVALVNGTEGIIETKDVSHFWLQIGEIITHADEDDGVILKITNIRHQGTRLVVDVVYPTGTIGTFSISEQFRRNITLL